MGSRRQTPTSTSQPENLLKSLLRGAAQIKIQNDVLARKLSVHQGRVHHASN